jgi:hypothetical protein
MIAGSTLGYLRGIPQADVFLLVASFLEQLHHGLRLGPISFPAPEAVLVPKATSAKGLPREMPWIWLHPEEHTLSAYGASRINDF